MAGVRETGMDFPDQAGVSRRFLPNTYLSGTHRPLIIPFLSEEGKSYMVPGKQMAVVGPFGPFITASILCHSEVLSPPGGFRED